MITRFIEATNGFNHGKFMVGQFEQSEWARPCLIDETEGEGRHSLLARCGWGRTGHIYVADLQTGEGAIFKHGGKASYDLNEKHQVWVCPLFEPFLTWLYQQDVSDLSALPATVELEAEGALYGYRRKGPEQTDQQVIEDWLSENVPERYHYQLGPDGTPLDAFALLCKDALQAMPGARSNR